LGAELEHLMPFAIAAEIVGDPDVAAMRKEQHPGAEMRHQLARRVELEDGIERRAVAGERHAGLHLRRRCEHAAALGHPDALAVPDRRRGGGSSPTGGPRASSPSSRSSGTDRAASWWAWWSAPTPSR